MKRKTGRKLLSFLLTLALVLGLVPGMSLTAYAADEVSENISLVNGQSLVLGTHYSVSGEFENEYGIHVYNKDPMTINARKGETITKVVLTYSWGNNKSSLSASAGTFDGNATISDINAQQVTISSSNTAGVKISAVRVYFEGDLNNPTVTLTGGANAKNSGGLLTQSYLPGAMDTVTYTALTGATFPEFETYTQNGVTVERTSDTVVTISGTPTANTEITVPDAESSSKIVTWDSSIINDSGRNGIGYQIRRNNSYSDTANGITLTKSGSGYASLNYGDWMTSGDVTLNFTTATGKFTSIEIETSQIYDGGNWTKDGNTLKWNGTPSNSVSLSGSSLYLEGVSSINFVIEMPTVSVTITAGDHMTKTADSGAESQTGLSGAMTAVVYTANDGYYFPTDYSVAAVNGISVTRNSYTQITVSGTPTADATITLTAPTAKTTPDAPTTATATDCTTADNNDGTLTGVTTAMEYKKSDAADWTAGTGSDITGLVPGTYYVRVKATETTNASTNQELTIKGFISYTVTFKVVNGKWNEGEGDAATADKTVTLTGYEGDTLKLTAAQIPAVGSKPSDTYKAGSWDVTPSADTEITAATTYTYTYAAKEATVVTKAPEAKTLTYTGSAQALVTAGEATGGTMQYALGTATEATQPYTTSIPTATNAGTYYVWYKVIGDESHSDSEATCVSATISTADVSITANAQTIRQGESIVSGTDKVTVEGLATGQTLSLITLNAETGNIIPMAAIIKDSNNTDTTQNYNITYTNGTLTILAPVNYTVTFKVVNGSWNDDTTADRIVNLNGYEGDTLKLTADQIPAAGSKPDDTFMAGSWNTVPTADVVITADTTYTYTYAAKGQAVVSTSPSANDITYDGSAHALVSGGSSTGGSMQYAFGNDASTAPSDGWGSSVPSATDTGIYYVWYMASGDDTHVDSAPACVSVTIRAEDKSTLPNVVGDAEDLYDNIKNDTNYDNISDDLNNAINDAQAILNNDNVTADEIADAISNLENAIKSAKEAKEGVDERIAAELKVWLDPLRTEIAIGIENVIATGEEATVTYEGDFSIPYEIMEKLQSNPQVTLVYTFTYEGETYTVTIPGRSVIADPEIPWYGPAYLLAHYGSGTEAAAEAEEPVVPVVEFMEYIVKPGDTLNDISAQYGTPVDIMVLLNGIKNQNLIFPGQKIVMFKPADQTVS